MRRSTSACFRLSDLPALPAPPVGPPPRLVATDPPAPRRSWPAANLVGHGLGSSGEQATDSVVTERSDEELIAEARHGAEAARRAALDALFARHYPRVAAWCLRLAGEREEAAELAQEVFLRVQTRLDSFRGESRFSTWLYQVTRSVAINRAQARARRPTSSLEDPGFDEPADPTPSTLELLADAEIRERFRQALRDELQPLEGQVVYLHFALGMKLDGITSLLGLANASGAKAYIVSAKRKLARGFGQWLAEQRAGRPGGDAT